MALQAFLKHGPSLLAGKLSAYTLSDEHSTCSSSVWCFFLLLLNWKKNRDCKESRVVDCFIPPYCNFYNKEWRFFIACDQFVLKSFTFFWSIIWAKQHSCLHHSLLLNRSPFLLWAPLKACKLSYYQSDIPRCWMCCLQDTKRPTRHCDLLLVVGYVRLAICLLLWKKSPSMSLTTGLLKSLLKWQVLSLHRVYLSPSGAHVLLRPPVY